MPTCHRDSHSRPESYIHFRRSPAASYSNASERTASAMWNFFSNRNRSNRNPSALSPVRSAGIPMIEGLESRTLMSAGVHAVGAGHDGHGDGGVHAPVKAEQVKPVVY